MKFGNNINNGPWIFKINIKSDRVVSNYLIIMFRQKEIETFAKIGVDEEAYNILREQKKMQKNRSSGH